MMETWTYSVVPVPGGWALEQPCGLPLMFLSGGRAESKAAELAKQATPPAGAPRCSSLTAETACWAVGATLGIRPRSLPRRP